MFVDLALSQPPKLGETSELTFTVIFNSGYSSIFRMPSEESLADSKAWVEFYWVNTNGSYSEAKKSISVPLEEVLVDGNISWQGNAAEKHNIKFKSTVKLPREGIWYIKGFFTGEGWEEPIEDFMLIAVTEDNAADLRTKEGVSSSLAYLSNFYYGRVGEKVMDEEKTPVIVELDISQAPRVGEEATLSCRISSLHDRVGYSAQITFWKRLADNTIPKISGEGLLVQGNLEWEGDLKANEPVKFSATIKFPKEGDWEISANGTPRDRTADNQGGDADNIQININNDRGSFGWEKRNIKFNTDIEYEPAKALFD